MKLKTKEKISKTTKNWIFEKTNKIDKPIAREKTNSQYQK